MANRKHNIVNNLDNLINMEIGKRMSTDGVKVKKGEIISEVADFSNVGKDNICMIKRGKVVPSLPVAMKIAEYFNMKVEDIFKIY